MSAQSRKSSVDTLSNNDTPVLLHLDLMSDDDDTSAKLPSLAGSIYGDADDADNVDGNTRTDSGKDGIVPGRHGALPNGVKLEDIYNSQKRLVKSFDWSERPPSPMGRTAKAPKVCVADTRSQRIVAPEVLSQISFVSNK
ncbi:hypothetical protein NX059_011198 [Plenodomus lindquistii]|nr:hypothetical protein NX059_011198 [Plenodomus lindquistii]